MPQELSEYAQKDLQRLINALADAGVDTLTLARAAQAKSPVLDSRLFQAWANMDRSVRDALDPQVKRLYSQLHSHLSELRTNPEATYARDRQASATSSANRVEGRTSITKKISVPDGVLEQVKNLTSQQLGDLIAKALEE